LLSQKGTVIITVLMMIAVATYLAVEITYRQRIDITRTGTLLALDQSEEYVKSAEIIAQFMLSKDLRDDILNEDLRDTLSEGWEKSQTLPVERGTITGQIFDLQGRLNINRLILAPAIFRPIFASLLDGLTELSIHDGSDTTTILAERVIDWVDVGQTPETDGLENQHYLGMTPPHKTGDRVLLDLSELLLIEGFTYDDLYILKDHVSFLPPTTKININTASDQLLNAVGCLNIVAINAAKALDPRNLGISDTTLTASFETSYIDNTICPSLTPTEITAKADLFSATSEFFRLEAESTVDNRTIKMHSILYRTGTTKSDVKTIVVQRQYISPI